MTETSTMTAQEMQERIAELEATNGFMQAVLDMFRETGRLPDQRIAELERQVLGLRSALKSVAAYPGTRKYLGNVVYDQALYALTDTEKAGQEAEARIRDTGFNHGANVVLSHMDPGGTEYREVIDALGFQELWDAAEDYDREHLTQYLRHKADDGDEDAATRLRNGGSDGE